MDCADKDRIEEARQELHRIINDREMKDAIILIFANKQDLQDGRFVMYDYFEQVSFKFSQFFVAICISFCLNNFIFIFLF